MYVLGRSKLTMPRLSHGEQIELLCDSLDK